MDNKTMLRGLKNIGPTIADRLKTVGIKTVGDLKRIGPAKAFNLVKDAYSDTTIPVCYYLYSLHGALEDRHWNTLAESTKSRLRREAGISNWSDQIDFFDAKPAAQSDRQPTALVGFLRAARSGGRFAFTLGVTRQSALLDFESSTFAIEQGEDEHTNPGIFGKALAQWLSEQLRATGVPVGEIIAEDFGWCVPVESKPHRLYVACASAEEGTNHWRVFAFAEGGFMARLLGTDQCARSVASLFATLKHILRNAPHVQGLREEAT